MAMTKKRALITGITGQDGSYLAELLLDLGYEVHGVVRRISQPNLSNLAAVRDRVTLHTGDMSDGGSLFRIIKYLWPHEVYNLAAMSQVRDSYDNPEATADINLGGLIRIMEAVRATCPGAKIYQACSSEMFGDVCETPQNEKTPHNPQSPYGISKSAAFHAARVWRESFGIPVYCGILFNHESERRGEAFLSRKVCKAVAEIVTGRRDKLKLGNLSAMRDWGYAPEYVKWIHRIVQHDTPDDFVIATGETHSVHEFVKEAFRCAGIDDWEPFVDHDDTLLRPAEVALLCGDASKSKRVLGFEPQVKFAQLVKIMVDAELAKLPQTTHEDARRILRTFPEAKLIKVKEDCVIGKHYHMRKEEKFILSKGECRLRRGDPAWSDMPMRIGEIYTVDPGEYHEFHIKKGSVLVGLNSLPYDPTDDHHAVNEEKAK